MINANNQIENIFSFSVRKILNIVLLFLAACVFCTFVFLDGNAKIIMLYVQLFLLMALIVTYKNSLNIFEVSIFIFLCVTLLLYAPKFDEMDSLVQTSYAISYRYGLSSRGLIATFIDIISPGQFISQMFVWHFIFSSTVFIVFIISIFLGHIIKLSNSENKLFIYSSTLIFLSCFTSPAAYFTQANFGRVEIFTLLFMLILIITIDKKGLRWIIPILALFTVATHLILVFFYIPLIGIMLLYQLLEKKDMSKGTVGLFITTVLFVLVGFCLYILLRENTYIFESSYDLYNFLIGKTNLQITQNWLEATMYSNIDYHLDGWRNRMGSLNTAVRLLLIVIINLPLVILFIVFWINCFKESLSNASKSIFILNILTIPFQAIAFFIFFDYGRWMIMVTMVQFMLLYYMVWQNNLSVMTVIVKTKAFLNKWIYVIILLCILMATLGPVNHTSVSSRISRIIGSFLLLF